MRPQKISKMCLLCGAAFLIPPCRDWREHCCSSVCKRAHAAKTRADDLAARTRKCLVCSTEFVARRTQIDEGQGRFCSKACGLLHNRELLNSETVKQLRAAGLRRAIAAGSITYRHGQDNPCWKGGRAASDERQRPKRAQYTRNYRKRNPHKVKEFSQRRLGRKTGRLPRGFVAKLFALQRKKCAGCRTSIVDGYHVDHITALSKGGKHVPENIQLLCATCNLRKAAKDPIEFMQSKGFLL